MKIATTLLAFSILSGVSSLGTGAQAGPSGPSARAAARLKKYPTSRWLAHYLPDDRYKIAGGVWKYVSTDLDTFYHRPESSLMINQPAGRVIGFSSAAEAEEAGYKPDPTIAATAGLATFPTGASAARAMTAAQRVMLSDGTSSIVLPAGWRKAAGPGASSQYVTSSSDFFSGPRGERFQIGIMNLKLPGNATNMDMGRFTNVRFFNSLKKNGGLSGGLDRLAQTSGTINSRLSGRNGLSQMMSLNNFKVFGIKLSGIEGVGMTSIKKMAGQPGRSYTLGRGSKLWSIIDFSPRQNIASVLKTVRLR